MGPDDRSSDDVVEAEEWRGIRFDPELDPGPFIYLDELVSMVKDGHEPSEQDRDLVRVFVEFAAFLDSDDFRLKGARSREVVIVSLRKHLSDDLTSKPSVLDLLPKTIECCIKGRREGLDDFWRQHLLNHPVGKNLYETILEVWSCATGGNHNYP